MKKAEPTAKNRPMYRNRRDEQQTNVKVVFRSSSYILRYSVLCLIASRSYIVYKLMGESSVLMDWKKNFRASYKLRPVGGQLQV